MKIGGHRKEGLAVSPTALRKRIQVCCLPRRGEFARLDWAVRVLRMGPVSFVLQASSAHTLVLYGVQRQLLGPTFV